MFCLNKRKKKSNRTQEGGWSSFEISERHILTRKRSAIFNMHPDPDFGMCNVNCASCLNTQAGQMV